jgi:hypothetical protein
LQLRGCRSHRNAMGVMFKAMAIGRICQWRDWLAGCVLISKAWAAADRVPACYHVFPPLPACLTSITCLLACLLSWLPALSCQSAVLPAHSPSHTREPAFSDSMLRGHLLQAVWPNSGPNCPAGHGVHRAELLPAARKNPGLQHLHCRWPAGVLADPKLHTWQLEWHRAVRVRRFCCVMRQVEPA